MIGTPHPLTALPNVVANAAPGLRRARVAESGFSRVRTTRRLGRRRADPACQPGGAAAHALGTGRRRRPAVMKSVAARSPWCCCPLRRRRIFGARPAREVRILIGFSAGGTTDIITRNIAPELTRLWGQAIVIENCAGAGGNIAGELVAKAGPTATRFSWGPWVRWRSTPASTRTCPSTTSGPCAHFAGGRRAQPAGGQSRRGGDQLPRFPGARQRPIPESTSRLHRQRRHRPTSPANCCAT